MANIFVTGATGFIGSRLVHRLVGEGHTVHALSRRTDLPPPPGFLPDDRPNFAHPNVRIFLGDITDRESLQRGMEGCTQVYHLAGYAKNWAPDRQTYFDINAGGLRNVCKTAADLKVERIVWTSTMMTFGATPSGEVHDEQTCEQQTDSGTPRRFTEYELSKVAAEEIAAAYVADGLPLVMVHPARVFGPGYFNEGNALSLVIDMYDRGKLPFLLGGGRNVGNFVYIDDVVSGLILALERGGIGEKYILGGENLSLKAFFELVDKASDKRHFQITIRRPGAMIYAWMQKQRAQWFGKYPDITPDWVRVFLSDWAYSSAKAQRELGYQITPIDTAVQKTYQWLLRVRAELQAEKSN